MSSSHLLHQPTASATGEFRDRGSKFLAFAYPVKTLVNVEEHLRGIKKKYHDARHHCYAYRLGPAGDTSFTQDDGEPAHTAGTPILGAIRSAQLSDVLVVVVRYFGGIKLGVRGLIDAYQAAAADAILQLPTQPIVRQALFRLDFSYEQTAEIHRLTHGYDLTQVAARYTEACSIDYALACDDFSQLQQWLQEHGIEAEFLREIY